MATYRFKIWSCVWIKSVFLSSGGFSALAASRCYNQNLNLYTCNMLDFVTELGFVAVLMKIYLFFEPCGLTLICKELALLACRLRVVLPCSYTVNTNQLGIHCVRLRMKRSPYCFDYES